MKVPKLRRESALFAALVILSATVILAGTLETQAKPGSSAPAFSAAGTDGKTHTLASVAERGPALLYFIKEGCPVNHQAAPFLVRMVKAYRGKANLVGVYNGSLEDAKAWAKRYGATFPILADPEYKIIRGYDAPFSPYLVEITKDRKIGALRADGSEASLAKANKLLASTAGMQVASMSFQGAPRGGG